MPVKLLKGFSLALVLELKSIIIYNIATYLVKFSMDTMCNDQKETLNVTEDKSIS